MESSGEAGDHSSLLSPREAAQFAALVDIYYGEVNYAAPAAGPDPTEIAGSRRKTAEVVGCTAMSGVAITLAIWLAEAGASASPLLVLGSALLLTALTATGSALLSHTLGPGSPLGDNCHSWLFL